MSVKENLSSNLVDFFLNVELVDTIADNDKEKYHFKYFSHLTNEFELKAYLKWSNSINKDDVDIELRNILVSYRHPIDSDIINGLIMLFCLAGKDRRNAKVLNTFFSFIEKWKLKQYMFFNGEQVEKIYTLKFKDFYIGNIDYSKFSDFVSRHTQSDFADKYKKILSNKAGIEIKNYEINIIDIYKWVLIVQDDEINLRSDQSEIVNIYLTSISRFYYADFKRKFYRQQEFVNSYFGMCFPLEIIEITGNMFVSIFYNFLGTHQAGWVLPIRSRLTDFYFPDPRAIEQINLFMVKNEIEIYDSKSEYSRYLETVTAIFSSAEKHIVVKNFNHAFVDFFVGLDFLLAPEAEKSKTLKRRISLLVYKDLSTTFEKQMDRLNVLYNKRSAYVHQGVIIDEVDLIELRKISRIVLSVLLENHKSSLNNNKLKFEDWIKRIDDLLQGIFKGLNPTFQQMSLIGVKEKRTLFLQDSLDKFPI